MANPIHQFEIIEYVRLPVQAVDLSFTNSSLAMVLGAVISTAFMTSAMRRRAIVPGRLQMSAELLYEFVGKMVKTNIGKKGRIYLPFIFTLLIFVLMGNLLGLVPYMFTYTSHLIVTGALALLVFFAVIGFGLYNHGTHFFSLFLPPNVPWWLVAFIIPIEIISFFVRPLTLSVRLFANMMAGHIVLKVVVSFAIGAASLGALGSLLGVFPVLINVAMLLFELLVAFVQAYVFAILACVYLKDSVDLHH
ncbi:MAG: F0F1 ATP synthase subunit A [Alphaproteobacteria bacterium]|nr:F0F1 ATP synthase subunit A [Alphaproteobacteria bacterium]MCB9974621.1 F0F1 ATP synthase subunit A [Rhodospirillales bacterium]